MPAADTVRDRSPRQRRGRRAPLLLATALVGTLAAATLTSAAAIHDTASAAADTGLRDPALTTGTLPNGMRYYVRVNKSPAHRVELRLAVNAGSLQEDEDQKGFAHFLEHMAFNGTTHFPHTSLVDFIETSGMRFGADLNAMTTPDETVYMLKLPTDDPTIVAGGLDVLQDWASGGITIDSNEVVGERGVVMGEWRMRTLTDTMSANYRAHTDSLWYGASRYATRDPIGDTTLLTTAQPGPIRRFYRDYYRPDLMAVVVVGDVDRQQMLREITRRFGSIPARTTKRPRVPSTMPVAADPMVDVYRGWVSPTVQMLWPAPVEPTEADAAVRQDLVAALLWQHLQHRLAHIQAQPSRPFLTATTLDGTMIRPLHVVGFQVLAWDDSLTRAFATVLTELQRVARHGVPDTTLAHEKAVLLRGLEANAGGALARPSAAYAGDYVQHFLTGEGPLLSPEQVLTLGRKLLPAITPEVLARAATELWNTRAGERLLVELPKFSHVAPPTRASLLALVDSVAHADIPAEANDDALAASPLLAHPPAPGKITAEKRDPVAGITEWTLSNGAHVILKPTANDPDQLLMRAWSPGGFSRMPDSLFMTPGRMVARVMTAAAGLGSERRDVLQRQLETTGLTQFQVNITYADESIDLAGSPKEREMLFQLLYLQFTAPKLDTAAIHGWASLAQYQGGMPTAEDQLNQIFADGEPRLSPISTQLAELLRPEQALAAYRDRFGNAADFTFILVGALTPAQAEPLVERYLASLPSTGAHETVKPLDVRPVLPKQDNWLRVLPFPRAETSILFDGPFPSSPDEYLRARQELGALTTVLGDRIRVRIREQLAGDYSPQLSATTHQLPIAGQPPERYAITGGFISAPERMQSLWREYEHILDSVRTHGATAEELARAVTIQRRQHETALEQNGYWLSQIELYHRLGIPYERIVHPFGAAPVTPRNLQLAAQRYVPKDVYIHVTLMPQDSTSYTRADRTARDSGDTGAPVHRVGPY
jgi:zinc protease